jgi:hypothetical protein
MSILVLGTLSAIVGTCISASEMRLLVLPTNTATYELEAPLLLVVTVPQLDLTLAGTLIRKECCRNIRSLLAARQ